MDSNNQSIVSQHLSWQCKIVPNQWTFPLYLVASEHGLQGVYWEEQEVVTLTASSENHKAAKILQLATLQLNEYLSGKRQHFEVPLDFKGTPFQKLVWAALQNIPYGTTISYSTLAKNIENPKAVRAVGSANGKNSIPIIIPCHRVIAGDGSLGGYSGGTHIKVKLLQLEKTGAC